MGNPRGMRRDFDALEQRRLAAIKLFDKELNNSEVGRQLKVSNQTVSRWRKQYHKGGQSALQKAGRAGRKPLLNQEQRLGLVEHLLKGPEQLGYETPLWTCGRVSHLIEEEFGIRYHPGHVWRILRELNWSPQRPVGKALERNEIAIEEWKNKTWPALKKKAQNEDRTIVFIDESGLSQRPHCCRTWAPRGETPVLFHHFNWRSLSVIAGLTLYNFYFEMFEESIRGPHVVVFLEHLQRCVPGKMLILWDRLPAHRSHLVRDYVATLQGGIEVAYLPAYAPELNPVEYIWGYLKQHELANVCAKDLWNLGEGARKALRRMRRRKRLVVAFWKQSSLWP